MRENIPSKIDLTIIGGGIAGAATAIASRARGLKNVVMIERSRGESFRVGETIPPPTALLLEQLGLSDILRTGEHLPYLGNCSAWGSDRLQFQDFLFHRGGHGWHLDRARFDASLVAAAADRGVIVLLETAVIACHPLADGRWRLTLKPRSAAPFSIETSFVADASGHRSLFARWGQTRQVETDSLCGIASVFSWPDNAPKDYYTSIEATEIGWWYASRLPRERAIVTFFSDRHLARHYRLDRLENWTAYLDRTRHARELIRTATARSKLLIQPASSRYLERMVGRGWLAVGDAACTFDPLSSSGIYKALLSAISAAGAIADYLKGDRTALEAYEQRQKQQLVQYQHDRREYYRMETRWPDSPFWSSRRDRDGDRLRGAG